MKRISQFSLIVSVILIALFQATDAKAYDDLNPPHHRPLVLHAQGSRVTYQPKPKHHKPHPKSCTTVEQIGWSIDLEDYQDGDTPFPTYYTDYLSDLGWYIEEFDACPITPEPNPGQ